jgi:hypothetical protein
MAAEVWNQGPVGLIFQHLGWNFNMALGWKCNYFRPAKFNSNISASLQISHLLRKKVLFLNLGAVFVSVFYISTFKTFG